METIEYSDTLREGTDKLNANLYELLGYASTNLNVKDFGVIGDGVTDDGPALNTLIASLSNDATIFFPAGTYLINTAVVVNKRLHVTGRFPVLTTTANLVIMTASTNSAARSKFSNLIFKGQGKATASRTGQFGLGVNAAGQTTTVNCSFTDFPGGGLFYQDTHTTGAAFGGVVSDCIFYSNVIGLNASSRGEFFTISGCISHQNTTGYRFVGGVMDMSCCISGYDGTGLEIVSGTNNAHGIVANSIFAHATTYGINCHDSTLGMTFNAVHIAGSSLRVADFTGAKFMGGTQDCPTTTLSNAVATVFQGVSFTTGYATTFSPSGTTTYTFRDCHHMDGRVAISPITFSNMKMSDTVHGTVQTTNATPLNTVLVPLVANSAGKWRLEVTAKITSATNINDCLVADLIAATKMTAAASGALEGSVASVYTPIKSTSMSSATATMDVSSDNLRAVFTGLASTTIKWDYKLTPLVN